MPPWMYTYTLVTYDTGLVIYVNYLARTGRRWTYKSLLLTEMFVQVWAAVSTPLRIRLAMFFQHMRKHTMFIARQHEQWFQKRAALVMNKMMNRALLEEKKVDMLEHVLCMRQLAPK